MLILKFISRVHYSLKIFKRNNKINENFEGYFLIELLLALSIGSIVIISFCMILNFLVINCKSSDIENEVLLNGRYAIEYIKNDIKVADEIISTSLINGSDDKYKDYMGFIVVKYNSDSSLGYKYKYTFYFLDKNKIYRAVVNKSSPEYPTFEFFSGKNVIAEFVLSIDQTVVDWEKGLIQLSIVLGGSDVEDTRIETKLKIKCPMDY